MIALLMLLVAGFPVADTTGAAPYAQEPDPARQVITRADIRAAGLYRVADLLRLVESVRTSTVEGLTWRVSLLDGDPFGGEAWTLILDGDRVDMDLLGQKNLSLLPVAVVQIDSVEVWTAPRIVSGGMASGGVIHVHTTQRHDPGAAVRVGGAIGLQNGDPGPYRYVPEMATLNVDKFGGDLEGWAGAAGERWRTSARFKAIRFYPTNQAALERNREILNGADIPRSRLFTGAIRFGVDGLGGRHGAQVIGGAMNDLWFYAPYGRELSTRRYFGQAAVRGTVGLRRDAPRGGPELTYRVSVAENRLDKRFEQSLGPDPRWRGHTATGGLEMAAPVGEEMRVTLGAGVERHSLAGAQGHTIGRFTGSISRARTAGEERIETALAVAEGDVAVGFALSSQHTLGSVSVTASAALAQRLPAETARLAFWTLRGYDAFEADVEVDVDPVGVTTTAHARLDAAYALAAGLRATAGVGLRSFRGLHIEIEDRAPDPDVLVIDRVTRIDDDVVGSLIHWRAAIEGLRSPWQGRLWLDAQHPVGGDAPFARAHRRVPRYRGGFRGAVAPAPGFTASAALGFQSSAHWPEYTDLGGGRDGLYDAAMPPLWLLDVALEKWFWQRRVRGSLLFLNLLAQEERYHPVGAILNRRFYLRVELRLG